MVLTLRRTIILSIKTTARKWAAAINESNGAITVEAPPPALVPAMVMATANRRQSTAIPLPVASSGGSGHQTFNINVSSTPSGNTAAAAGADPPSSPPTIDTATDDDDELLRLFFTELRSQRRWQRSLSPLNTAKQLLVEHQYDLNSFKSIELRHWSEDWHLPEGIQARLDTEVSKWLRRRYNTRSI